MRIEGARRRPKGGRAVERGTVPARPVVVSEGVELEPVWFPHRDAASLLPEYPSMRVGVECSLPRIGLKPGGVS